MKNKKGEIPKIGMIIMIAVGVIFAVALLVPIANTTNQMTSKQAVSNQSVSTATGYLGDNQVNESINYTIYTQSTWKVSECPLTSVVLRNGAGTALVDATDYTLDEANGRFSLLNTTKTVPATALNLTYVDYSHCADGYNTNGGSRSIANLVVIFGALAIFAFVIVGIKGEWFK